MTDPSAMTATVEFGHFLDALDERLVAHEKRELAAGEELKEGIAALFAEMDPAVAAATLAVQVMEARLGRRAAEEFSVMRLAVTREKDLSRIFAHLLDPGETHDQGETFLACLLDELRLNVPDKRIEGFRSASGIGSRITTEYPTDPIPTSDSSLIKGSMDIVVEFADNHWIAIENKPWAGQQKEQIARYLHHLQKLAAGSDTNSGQDGVDKILLLYWIGWSGEGSEPDFKGLDEKDSLRKRCITMPYRETRNRPSVEGWLRRCVVACEAPQVQAVLLDAIRYIQNIFTR